MRTGESLPATEHRIDGAAALTREADRPGSGDYRLTPRRGPDHFALLDGHGLFATEPDAGVAEVRRIAGAPWRPATRP